MAEKLTLIKNCDYIYPIMLRHHRNERSQLLVYAASNINSILGLDLSSLRRSFSLTNLVSSPLGGSVGGQGKQPHVLLLDDEKDITKIFKMGLTRKGFVVDAFNDPMLALEKFEAGKYDVIITDMRMPAMNGLEFYKRIEKLDNKAKVFFFSAFEVFEQEAKLAFPNLPKNAFIKKPVTIEQLAHLIG